MSKARKINRARTLGRAVLQVALQRDVSQKVAAVAATTAVAVVQRCFNILCDCGQSYYCHIFAALQHSMLMSCQRYTTKPFKGLRA